MKAKKESGPAYETINHLTHIDGDYAKAHNVKDALTNWRIVQGCIEDGASLETVALASVRFSYFIKKLPNLALSDEWKREISIAAHYKFRKFIYSLGK